MSRADGLLADERARNRPRVAGGGPRGRALARAARVPQAEALGVAIAPRPIRRKPAAPGARSSTLLHRHRRSMLKRRRELAQLIVRSRRGAQALPYGVAVLDADYRLDWCNDAGARPARRRSRARPRAADRQHGARSPSSSSTCARGFLPSRCGCDSPGGARARCRCRSSRSAHEEHLLLSQDVTGAAPRRERCGATSSPTFRTSCARRSRCWPGFLETIQDLKLDAARVRDYVEPDGAAGRAHEAPDRRPADAFRRWSTRRRRRTRSACRCGRCCSACARRPKRLSGGQAPDLARDRRQSTTCSGAKREIASAFINLVTNAVRYTPRGGEIRLALAFDECQAASSRSRTRGIGIDPEHLPRLTERFYRVDREPLARDWRHRPRPVDRQARACAPPGRARHRQRRRARAAASARAFPRHASRAARAEDVQA